MAQRTSDKAHDPGRGEFRSEPVTEYPSKMVMLRGERHDNVTISEVVDRINHHHHQLPQELTVIQRTDTYYGPELKLNSTSNSNYLLTAPGPDSHLLLWEANTGNQGKVQKWTKVAEVKADFANEQPQYDICPYCGDPLKTLEHERQSAVGQCDRA